MTRRTFLQMLLAFLMRPRLGTSTGYWLMDVSRLDIDTVLAPAPFMLTPFTLWIPAA